MPNDVSSRAWRRLRERFGRNTKPQKPLTTDERVWLFILSLYMAVFCVSGFVYWDILAVKVIGVTAALGGLFMFVASFFDPESRGQQSDARHPLIWYVMHTAIMLAILTGVRVVGGMMNHQISAMVIIYGGLLAALILFRKELIQLLATLFALLFLVLTIMHWQEIVTKNVSFEDISRRCFEVAFRLGPVQDVKNLILTGNYMGYLSKIEYRNPAVNLKASHLVRGTGDDELLKTERIFAFVSREIEYISDPLDGIEYPKAATHTLAAGSGDCEDQTLLLCSLLETVGVKSYMVFTDEHVFAVVQFQKRYPDFDVQPYLFIDSLPCYALDPSDPEGAIGDFLVPSHKVRRVFDVRRRTPVDFVL
jgi:hypothetical protein